MHAAVIGLKLPEMETRAAVTPFCHGTPASLPEVFEHGHVQRQGGIEFHVEGLGRLEARLVFHNEMLFGLEPNPRTS